MSKKIYKEEEKIKDDKLILMTDDPNNIIGSKMTLSNEKKVIIDRIIKKDFPYTIVHINYLEN